VSKEFSQRVKQAISEKNVSRRAASTYAGLRVNAISTIINHPEQTPETETVRKLASYFVESQDEWLELAGHRTKEQPPPAGLSALRWHYSRMSPLHRESLLAIADTFTALEAKGVAETNDTSLAEEHAEYTTEEPITPTQAKSNSTPSASTSLWRCSQSYTAKPAKPVKKT